MKTTFNMKNIGEEMSKYPIIQDLWYKAQTRKEEKDGRKWDGKWSATPLQ